MRSLGAVLLAVLPLFLLPIATAFPSYASHQSHSNTPSTDNQRSSWRALSDSLIRKVWKLPENRSPLDVFAQATVERGGPAGKWVARYGEDVVLRFTLASPEEAAALADAANVLILDVWEFNNDWVDIRVAKDVVPSLLGLLPPSMQRSHVALMHDLDLAQAIFESYPCPSSTSTDAPHDRFFTPSVRSSSSTNDLFFQNYQPLSVIVPWMNLLASMFSTHVRRINVGISYEGRDIPGLRVGVHPTNDDQPKKRRTILITGGAHAREWISTSSVNYLAWSLITSYGKDPAVTKLLEAFDWVFVPTLNPDGYVYSWESDRLWRKNRQPTSLRFCKGVDLDHSYPFRWDGESTKGNPCSEAYAGEEPLEGVEAKRFVEWAKNETENNNVEFVTLLDLHSYSQQILYPYSYTCEEQPPTVEDLAELALGLAKAIRLSSRGRHYAATSACEGNVGFSKSKDGKTVFPRMETGGGSLLDWFYQEMKVHYAFQIKLRDTGSYGFLLPKEHIIPTGRELRDAILYLGRYLSGQVGVTADLSPEEAFKQAQAEKHGESSTANEEVDEEGEEEEEEEEREEENFELRRRRRK